MDIQEYEISTGILRSYSSFDIEPFKMRAEWLFFSSISVQKKPRVEQRVLLVLFSSAVQGIDRREKKMEEGAPPAPEVRCRTAASARVTSGHSMAVRRWGGCS